MRATIKENAITEQDPQGCLIGSEDEYLASFSAHSKQMLSMFDKSHEYWQARVDQEDAYAKKILEVQAYFAEG